MRGGACSHSRAPSVHHGKLGTNEWSNDKRDCWLRDRYALAGPGTRFASPPLNLYFIGQTTKQRQTQKGKAFSANGVLTASATLAFDL
jgi:hypothetical protein